MKKHQSSESTKLEKNDVRTKGLKVNNVTLESTASSKAKPRKYSTKRIRSSLAIEVVTQYGYCALPPYYFDRQLALLEAGSINNGSINSGRIASH